MTSSEADDYVFLNRRFARWADDVTRENLSALERRGYGSISWDELLTHQRVVVLAEAGSGKSRELRQQAHRLRLDDKFAFDATVEDVANEGLLSALGRTQRAKFEEWVASESLGYFFVDSVDEAKLSRIRIETAFRKLDDGIAGQLSRAHIILSGRYTDWEFKSDLNRLKSMLPTSEVREPELLPPDVIGKILNNEWKRKEASPPQEPLVVLMISLDEERVRTFAAAKGVTDLDALIAAITNGGLGTLVRRPVDLGWIVDTWTTRHRLGSFAEMLGASIELRLRETNQARTAGDGITVERAKAALERIGAALVFGQADKIMIPEPDHLASDGSLDLANILPDWTEEDRRRLLARSVFDPATFGRARLHNDNEGVVRSYLAAKWLRARRASNASPMAINELLFAEKYGIRLVKPAAAKTAAWLSGWDADVANEVIARQPRLLMEAADPAALPLSIKVRVLTALVRELANGDQRLGWLQHDSLRRFAEPDLATCIRKLWGENGEHAEVRYLLLDLIFLGRMSGNIDLLESVTFAQEEDRTCRVIAARGLLDMGGSAVLDRYAKMVKGDAAKLPSPELWIAVEALFRSRISPAELLAILGSIEWNTYARDGVGFEHTGPALVGRITDAGDLEILIEGLLELIGPAADEPRGEDSKSYKALAPGLRAAAISLLNMSGADDVPLAAIDAALRLGAHRFFEHREGENAELDASLHSSWRRRRRSFWRAVEVLVGKSQLRGEPITNVHQLAMLGWASGLKPEDLTWLLEDAVGQSELSNRRLAVNAALTVWRDNGMSAEDLKRIEPVARLDPETSQSLDWIVSPPAPDPQHQEHLDKMALRRAEHAQEVAERDQSWINFLEELKADPEKLRNPPPVAEGHVDRWRFYFWQLLSAMTSRGSRYQIDNVDEIVPLVGDIVANAGRDGLIAFWRENKPDVESRRLPEKRNTFRRIDCMGLAGVSLEAGLSADWATKLNTADARRATEYATLEMNGLPTWIESLALARPTEVNGGLMEEIIAQLEPYSGPPRHSTIQHVSHGSPAIMRLVAPSVFAEFKRLRSIPADSLGPALTILRLGLDEASEREEFRRQMIVRFRDAKDLSAAGAYLLGAFAVDPVSATDELTRKLDELTQDEQTQWALAVLPSLFGDRIQSGGVDPGLLSFEILERLIIIAFRTIRPSEDRVIVSGEVYSLDARNNSERTREILFNRLAATPGEPTIAALHRLRPIVQISPTYMHELVVTRAANDAEASPWPSSEAHELELEFDVSPCTSADLQKVAMSRIREINHDAHSHDFAQGSTLKLLPDEAAVQNWVAIELFHRRRRGYTAERESEVVNAKKPDIRLRSGDASLPIEIKVAESWRLAELEDALNKQLEGRYLLHSDARYGVLLLVHRRHHPEGWSRRGGPTLNFEQLVAHLEAMARSNAAKSGDSAKAEIATLNVSDIPDARRRRSAL